MIRPDQLQAALDFRVGSKTADQVSRYLVQSNAEKSGIIASNKRQLLPEIQSALKAYDMLQSKGFDTKLAMLTVCLAMDGPPEPNRIDMLYKQIKNA